MSHDTSEVVEERLAPNLRRWTLSSPRKRNAVTPAMLDWIAERCRQLRGEVVIVRGGAGPAFCSGFDLGELARANGDDPPDAPLVAATHAMLVAEATFIAAVGGVAVGAGVELAASCDLRVVARTATFAVPAGRVGVVYHAAGIRRMLAVMGPAFVRRALLCGHAVPATDPCLQSVFDAIVAADRVDDVAAVLASELLALDPHSVAGHRVFLRAAAGDELTDKVLGEHQARRRLAYARTRSADGES